jgi:SOS-response transcriptional repressor LexA
VFVIFPAMALPNRIREHRERLGLSQAELAERVDTSQPQIDRLEKGERGLTDKWMRRLAAGLQCDPADLLSQPSGAAPALPPGAASPPSTLGIDAPVGAVRPVELPLKPYMPLDVPVFGVAAGNPMDGAFQLETGVIDYVRRAPGIMNARDVYALYVTGESMVPRFRHGELLYISANRPVRIGDDVVVCIRPERDGDPERCFIKMLVRRHPDYIEVEQFNPPKRMKFDRADIIRVHRVLTMADVLGV